MKRDALFNCSMSSKYIIPKMNFMIFQYQFHYFIYLMILSSSLKMVNVHVMVEIDVSKILIFTIIFCILKVHLL